MNPTASTTQRILEELLREENAHATGPQLAARLNILPGMVGPYMAELRKLGYEIVSDPHLGFRVVSCPDILLADELKARLRIALRGSEPTIGREISVYKQTDSTADLIERLAVDRSEEGMVIFAEAQAKGRGRRGRKWVSPTGAGLWFSVLLRPTWPPQAVTRITILSAVALVNALREVCDLPAQLKWPNDVLLNGKKVAGILTEMEADSDSVRFVNLGIGVNVRPIDFPPEVQPIATTVDDVAGRAVRRVDLAVSILAHLDRYYKQASTDGFDSITRAWGDHCATLGKRVTILVGARRVEGQAMALDENGSLLVRDDAGRTECIVGGDIVLEQ